MLAGRPSHKVSKAGTFWAAEAEDQDYLQDYRYGKNQFSPYRSAARWPLRTRRSPPGSSGDALLPAAANGAHRRDE
jgi:hypothetical protein